MTCLDNGFHIVYHVVVFIVTLQKVWRLL